jgi:hypothetical protein
MVLVLASAGGKYVAGAYLVFVAMVLLYVVIISSKLARLERELHDLNELAEKRPR